MPTLSSSSSPSPHKKPINDLFVHPSGKLVLIIARDNRYCCRLIEEANLVYLDLCGQSNLPGYGGQGRGAQGQGCEVAI